MSSKSFSSSSQDKKKNGLSGSNKQQTAGQTVDMNHSQSTPHLFACRLNQDALFSDHHYQNGIINKSGASSEVNGCHQILNNPSSGVDLTHHNHNGNTTQSKETKGPWTKLINGKIPNGYKQQTNGHQNMNGHQDYHSDDSNDLNGHNSHEDGSGDVRKKEQKKKKK